MTSGNHDAFFIRDGDSFLPTPIARGPWDPGSLHGRVVAGLISREIEQRHGDPALHFSRLTVDLFRLPRLAPLEVRSEVIREGNRIRVADAVVVSEGMEIARGRCVMLRRTDPPEGDVWSPPAWDAPHPDEIPPPPAREGSGLSIWDTRPVSGGTFGMRGSGEPEQRRTWLRETRVLVEGEKLSPFVRCALAADFTNPFANSGNRGLNYVNADITLYLHRLPVGDWLGFEVASHQSAEGIAVGETTIYDVEGPVGRSIVCGVVNQHRR